MEGASRGLEVEIYPYEIEWAALVFWQDLQASRVRKGKEKILTWMKMNIRLHTFLYWRLLGFRHNSKSVQEYTKEFDPLVRERCGVP